MYNSSSDLAFLLCCSVGDAKLEGAKVNVFVTAPGTERKGKTVTIGKPFARTPTDEGDLHKVELDKFKETFPSTDPKAKVEDYVVEAYFDKELGGDHWGPDKPFVK